MKTKWLLLFVLLASVLLLAGCGETLEWKVPVMVAETDGISVSGENPVWVNPGETVSFSVALEDGVFYLDNDAGASYENGTLTLSRVLYPTTVTLETVRNPSYYGFDLPAIGIVSIFRFCCQVTILIGQCFADVAVFVEGAVYLRGAGIIAGSTGGDGD